METMSFITKLKKHWETAVVVLLLVILVTTIVTGVQHFYFKKYRSTVQLLMYPQYTVGTDPYTVSKSTEYVSRILTEVIHTR